MNWEEKKRLVWVKLYEQTKDAWLTCRRCGISRPTLRKWFRRYQEQSEAGLHSQSRRPNGIKFRPNKPGSQHLNCKVERSQETDLRGFTRPSIRKPLT